MFIKDKENNILYTDAYGLDLVKTFECGQCFRWNMDSDGVYRGVARGIAAKLWKEGDRIYLSSSGEADADFWNDYFDMGLDYAAVTQEFSAGEYLDECCRYGMGIRILHQERWEALCSFIISQCNNIPRIKKIVETLCFEFGDRVDFEGKIYYSFPSAERLALLTEEDLAVIRSGYRAKYIISAAKMVQSGELDLEELAHTDMDTAMKALLSINGVGKKVANCAILFGLGHMEAFPIDVWMKRALKDHFAPDFDPATLGPYAGLAQQYIFYYERSRSMENV